VKLKPCPFHPPLDGHGPRLAAELNGNPFVECMWCAVKLRGTTRDPRSAVKAWNTRPYESKARSGQITPRDAADLRDAADAMVNLAEMDD